MKIYLDIDGTLIHEDLTENFGKPAAGLADFIRALRPFDVSWLTTHCRDGNPEHAQKKLKAILPPELHTDIDRIKPTTWDEQKTEGIDWDEDFIWFDDTVFEEELARFQDPFLNQKVVTMDLRANPRQLQEITKEILEPLALSLDPQYVYRRFDEAGLIVVTGYVGSGKSTLIFSYLDYLTKRYTKEEFTILAYDVTGTNYFSEEPVTPWAEVVAHADTAYAASIAAMHEMVQGRLAGAASKDPRILIHVTECDLFHGELKDKLLELCLALAKHGREVNMQLIYETSRPAPPSLPQELVDAAGVKVLCPVVNDKDALFFIGTTESLPRFKKQMKVFFKSTGETKDFDLNLPRKQN